MTVGEPFSVSANQELGILPVDVRVVDDMTRTESESPEFGSCQTYTIPQTGTALPVQILQRRLRREKAYIEVNFSVSGSVWFASTSNPLTNPNPSGYLVNVPVAGLYRLGDWENQQPLYCIASVAGLSVSVIDQAFGSVS